MSRRSIIGRDAFARLSSLTLVLGLGLGSVGAARAEERCRDYADGKRTGEIDSKHIQEASGLAASVRFPGVLWTHNDSGGEPLLFALSDEGELLASYEVPGADIVDWEDLALGPCGQRGARACLYIADTGDNEGTRDDQVIYRVREPDLDDASDTTEEADAMRVTFEEPADVEAMFVDGQAQLWLVGKGRKDATLYRVGRFEAGAEVVAELVAERDDIEFITAADADATATRIVLRSDSHAWELFRPTGRSMASAFLGELLEVELDKERQGEALALVPDGSGFYTTSEGKDAPLRWYRCKKWGASLSGKEDGGGIVTDPPEPAAEGCATGESSPLALLALAFLALRGSRSRSRRDTAGA